jgi:hypothetical protein
LAAGWGAYAGAVADIAVVVLWCVRQKKKHKHHKKEVAESMRGAVDLNQYGKYGIIRVSEGPAGRAIHRGDGCRRG